MGNFMPKIKYFVSQLRKRSFPMFISSIVSYAMKVHVKWRVVAGTVGTLILLVITYKVFSVSESCDVEYHDSAEAAIMNAYCNPPHLPAAGQEGDVPLASEKSDGYSLVSVHVVIRHGDRTAIHSLPNTLKQSISCKIPSDLEDSVTGMNDFYRTLNDYGKLVSSKRNPYENYTLFPDQAVCERSMLTPLGAAQHVRNGRFLREKYSKHLLLNSARFSEQVLVRGTKYQRTFHSAVAFLYGFLPEFNIADLNFEMADNNTMCTGNSNYQCWCPAIADLLNVFSCTFRQDLSKLKEHLEPDKVYNHVSGLYRQLSEKLHISPDNLPKISHIFDVGATHFCHNRRLLTTSGGCVEPQIIRSMYDAVNAVGQKARKDKDFLRIAMLKMQPLMYEIAHRMQHQVSGGTPIKMVLYSGHDSTVDPLSCALGILDGVWPRYASRLVFELYIQNGESFLRVLLDGVVVTGGLTFCRDRLADTRLGLCKLRYFLDFVNRGSLETIHENNYLHACTKFITV